MKCPACILLTCFLTKYRLREPGVEYVATLLRIVRCRVPIQIKHTLGLLSVLIEDIAWRSATSGSAACTKGLITVPRGPRRTWRDGAPSSTPQYNLTALIAVILRCSSCSGDFPGKVRIASTKPSYSSDMSTRTKASRVSSLTTIPESCRSLSFTGYSDLYYSLISLRSSLRFRYFSLYNRLIAF